MQIRIKHFKDHGTAVVLVAERAPPGIPAGHGPRALVRVNFDHRAFQHFLIDWRHVGSPEVVEYDPATGTITVDDEVVPTVITPLMTEKLTRREDF